MVTEKPVTEKKSSQSRNLTSEGKVQLVITGYYIPKEKGMDQQGTFRDGADWASLPRWIRARVHKQENLSLAAIGQIITVLQHTQIQKQKEQRKEYI